MYTALKIFIRAGNLQQFRTDEECDKPYKYITESALILASMWRPAGPAVIDKYQGDCRME